MVSNIEELEDKLGGSYQEILDLMNVFRTSPASNGFVVRDGRKVVQLPQELDRVMRSLTNFLTTMYEPPDHVHGFIAGRSAATNATIHLGQRTVLTVDIKSFFPSITRQHVVSGMRNVVATHDILERILDLCFLRGSLPIGYSTSPILSNFAFLHTDNALQTWAQECDLNLSRYADDISVSGEQISDGTLESLEQILQEYGWTINRNKTRFLRRGHRQHVTGYYIGLNNLHVSRSFKRNLRWHVHMLKILGPEGYEKDVSGTSIARLYGMIGYLKTSDPSRAQTILDEIKPLVGSILAEP